jgi:hypothetical protein
MRNIVKKLAAVLFVLINFGFLSMAASADVTLSIQSGPFGGPVNVPGVGGVYTFPYTFNITSGSTTTTGVELMCIDFTRDTPLGATWQATPETISAAAAAALHSSPTEVQLDEDAYILAEILNSPTTTTADLVNIEELQFAAWQILAGTKADTGNATFDNIATGYMNDAAHNAPAAGSSFYDGFTLYVPDPDGDSTEQRFLGFTGTGVPHLVPTPEPSSLMLLGTGVLGAAGMLRKRFVKA